MPGLCRILLFIALLGGEPATLPAQSDAGTPAPATAPRKKGRTATMKKLREDLGTAMTNATRLTDKQKQSLQTSREFLQQAIDARRSGGKEDRKKTQNTLDAVKRVFQKAAFRAEDKQAVMEDLRNLQVRKTRPVNRRPLRYPPVWGRGPVYRRFP